LAAVTSRLTPSLDLDYDTLQGGMVDGSPVPADVLADARISEPVAEDGLAVGPPSLIDADDPVPGPTGR